MSWQDKVQNNYVIECGDGSAFTPLWKNASQEHEWNVAEFNFPGIEGTLVKKSKKLGRKFPLEFYFQGENNLDNADAFDLAANDPRPWIITHPYYGKIIVQVPQLTRNDSSYNVTEYTGIAIETITEENPRASVDTIELIQVKKIEMDDNAELILTSTPTAPDVNSMATVAQKNYKSGVKIISIPSEFESYVNLFHAANAAINTATASPLLAMRATISFITFPSRFTADVKSRLELLVNQFNTLRNTVLGLLHVSSKQIYQTHGSTFISSMCQTAVTPLAGNYRNSKDVLSVMDSIVASYNNFLADLDTVQSPNGGNPLSFIPESSSLFELEYLVSVTVSNLYSIALSSQQERTLVLTEDTNIFLLTHRLYSLDPDDNNINEMIANNGWGRNEFLQIKKGTKVVYYI